MRLREPRALLARILQILNLSVNFFSNDRDQPTDPTSLLPERFEPKLSIRQGRAKFWNGSEVEFDEGTLQYPLVHTDLGDIEGYHMKVMSGRHIYAFEGIPYAEPPVGERRFRAPVPKEKWNGTLQAKTWGSRCVQKKSGPRSKTIGKEDCLYLNIYTPVIPNSKKSADLPTMIFIHGGLFGIGTSKHYGPSYLLQQDVVLVTFNYRLGAFGFFTDGTNSTTGNYGLKDQSLVIDFVHKHIDRFGGNPSRIILFGQSAGACSTHFQIMSNFNTKDRISAAISLSGSAFNTWTLRPVSQIVPLAVRVATLNNCRPELGSEYMVDCLRSRSAHNITQAAAIAAVLERVTFLPVIEPDVPGAFISDSPRNLYKLGKVANIPFIFSTTSRELEFGLAVKLAGLERVPRGSISLALWPLAPELLDYKGRVNNEFSITQKIIRHYGGERYLSKNPEALGQIATDRHFYHGIRTAIDLHSKIAPTYAEYFSYRHYLGYANDLHLDPFEFGTVHGEDMPLIFNRTGRKPIRRDDQDFTIVQLLQNLYTNFATFGEPLYTSKDYKDHRIWNTVNNNASIIKFLQIDKDVKMVTVRSFEKATTFWNSLNIRDS